MNVLRIPSLSFEAVIKIGNCKRGEAMIGLSGIKLEIRCGVPGEARSGA